MEIITIIADIILVGFALIGLIVVTLLSSGFYIEFDWGDYDLDDEDLFIYEKSGRPDTGQWVELWVYNDVVWSQTFRWVAVNGIHILETYNREMGEWVEYKTHKVMPGTRYIVADDVNKKSEETK